jgi:glycine dehydrogenase subunit 2
MSLPECDVPEAPLPEAMLRSDNELPELSQSQVVRHYLDLSHRNFGVDSGFYPLGSCTMKYNPKLSEEVARLPGFANSHPMQPPQTVQGNLTLMAQLQNYLGKIAGFPGISLQPLAGAHGELTALLMMRAYHHQRGEPGRTQVLIPDSAHGTNPASTSMAGYSVLEIPSDARGNIDIDALKMACDQNVVGLMLTNPNTLGLFEEKIEEIVSVVHSCGGLVYGDGANMNALAGIARPGDLGFDLMHFNLHKTFGTPHGGGGPGSGPVAASRDLMPYLPGPVVVETDGHADGPRYRLKMPEKSIGRVCSFHGSFGVLVRAYAYIRMHGAEGLRQNALHAALNANYLRVGLRDHFHVPYDRINMHEFVCAGRPKKTEVRAMDVSKRLMDYGFHPPTNYFPLIVPEALMIEPTETETKETLDSFIAAMQSIAEEAVQNPSALLEAPHTTPVGRLDEVGAARELMLCDKAASGTET